MTGAVEHSEIPGRPLAVIGEGLYLLILLLGGYRSLHALVIFEVYYILVVPLFLIPGLIGLIKAMAGQIYRYPLIGGRDGP